VAQIVFAVSGEDSGLPLAWLAGTGAGYNKQQQRALVAKPGNLFFKPERP